MKTSFSRTFVPAAIILLVALGSIGLMFQAIARYVLTDHTMSQLQTCADTVSSLALAYHTEDSDARDFWVNLSVAADIADADILILDAQGRLMICSDAPMGCSHKGLVVSREYLNRVISTGGTRDTSAMQGIFEEVRHVVSVPIRDPGGEVLGIVLACTPITVALAALTALSRFFLMITVTVLVASILIMSLVARRHANPIAQLSRAAVAFGHGDFDARVQVLPAYPEEIRELSIAFNNMAASLQKSEYQRQEFVANVSHELKTPMTTIAGFADGILDGTIPPEQHEHYLLLISEETKRMSRLVRSMLDISRLQDTGGIPEEQMHRFDVTECAGLVLLRFEQKITQKDLQVQVDMPELPVYTQAHQDHIVQVIYNLLDNAVKFCPSGGELSLTVRTGGSKVYVTVANSGTPIPPEELPLVFDRFHKLDKSRTQNRDGWGLGLYIVRTIICAHGEDISVESNNEKTAFTFTLPLVN